MFKVLVRKEPTGQISVITSEVDDHIEIFDVEAMARAVGSEVANQAYQQATRFVRAKPFSVLLQYPDNSTYYAWVRALDAADAVVQAKNDWQEEHPDEDLPDFEMLIVLDGHVDAVRGGYSDGKSHC